MAIDYNAIKLLLWSKNLGVSFDRTLTLGRQGLICSPNRFRRAVRDFGIPANNEAIGRCFHHVPFGPLYADELLRFLGAKELVSVDRSNYEGATLIHDLNGPFPEAHRGRYDFVFDGGTLEHIFNYPAALRHCLELLRPGGHFMTVAPASGQMGHGFYQISPELFFRVFSAENGFALRKTILFDLGKVDAPLFEVRDPAVTGRRVELLSSRPIYLAALAQRTALVPVLARPPQQSDYAALWDKRAPGGKRDATAPSGALWRLRVAINPYLPYWVRYLRLKWTVMWKRSSPRLGNRKQYRRVPRAEMCRERVSMPPAS